MEKYETIINKLRNTQPVLKNPEELTCRILSKIEHISQKKRSKLLPLITGLTASFVLVWMIVEINDLPPASLQIPNHKTDNLPYRYNLTPSSLQFSMKERLNIFYSELKKRRNRQQKIEQLTQKMKGYETK